ncbi:5-dehydro-4-deoxyglucarate dehydratase [Segeticoccus rhizosphaerae]|uniref:5-dehydro-4-deoxyglucarate dehydratase n=1 Tax=Segeticoccus rhizosphaerae TaxID=1104777 RepID=UPI0010C0CEA3|nr:5-dehydro-4-deoxyglucarate dehydratase [Ornithinicoccus soli]
MHWAPEDLPLAISGLLAFPITPFDADGDLETAALRRQVAMLQSFGAQAIFPACGTGEMQSLSGDEYIRVIRACVEEVDGRIPVVAGVGFGHSIAKEMLAVASDTGADGALVFPPYLDPGASMARRDYFASLADSTELGLLVYQRGSMVFTPSEVTALSEVPNIVGIKDGTGRVDLLVRQIAAAPGKSFAFFNGVPTAELVAPALRAIGIDSYSSALLNFVPEIARAFYDALAAGDTDSVADLMARAVVPFVQLRDRAPSYAVSLVKAGVRLRGLDVGPVRPPLAMPTASDLDDLVGYINGLGLDTPIHGSAKGAR